MHNDQYFTADTLPPSSFGLAKTLHAQCESMTAQERIAYASTLWGNELVLASSFGPEDVAMIHMAHAAGVSIRVITLDTGRLHDQTYALMDEIRRRYDLSIEVYTPDTASLQALVRQKGFHSFYDSVENRRECCAVRKVEPLKRALSGARAWITGVRAEQSPTRTDLSCVEYDLLNGGLIKVNPLVQWTATELWAFLRAHDIPTNPLHDEGFASIGCAPCTRAVAPGASERSGRWWWETPEDKECGLHARNTPVTSS